MTSICVFPLRSHVILLFSLFENICPLLVMYSQYIENYRVEASASGAFTYLWFESKSQPLTYNQTPYLLKKRLTETLMQSRVNNLEQ